MKTLMGGRWKARDYQKSVLAYLEDGGLRADVCAHRRWGKDEVALAWVASQAIEKKGTYWHLLPEASQGRKAIWDAVNPHTGRRRIDEAFPKSVRERTRDAEMMLHLKGGSTWQVVGSDNYNFQAGVGVAIPAAQVSGSVDCKGSGAAVPVASTPVAGAS